MAINLEKAGVPLDLPASGSDEHYRRCAWKRLPIIKGSDASRKIAVEICDQFPGKPACSQDLEGMEPSRLGDEFQVLTKDGRPMRYDICNWWAAKTSNI